MSILDKETLDGIAVNEGEEELRLLLTDHLDWSNEYSHLLALQDKINAYIEFCEGQQYQEIYGDVTVERIVFEIHFRYEPTAKALHFLNIVQQQVIALKIVVEWCLVEE